MMTLREKLLLSIKTNPSHSVNPQIFYWQSGIDESDINYQKFDEIFEQFPVFTWMCTDTTVGVFAITLNSTLIGYTTQPARKSDINIYYLSKEFQDWVVEVVRSCVDKKETQYSLAKQELLDAQLDEINIFEDRLRFTEFPGLTALGLLVVPVESNCYDVFHDNEKIDTLAHQQIDTIEKCARRHEGSVSLFIDIFFRGED